MNYLQRDTYGMYKFASNGSPHVYRHKGPGPRLMGAPPEEIMRTTETENPMPAGTQTVELGMPPKPKRAAVAKSTIHLLYNKDAHAAAAFYAETFPDSTVAAVHHAPSDYPGGKKGDVLTVEFTVAGIACLGLNGGPMFKHNEAFSFQIATDDQHETDRYWNAIMGNGGEESECGWFKDRWGVSWHITPRVLTDALAIGGEEARHAFDAMMGMKKIDAAAIQAARRGQ